MRTALVSVEHGQAGLVVLALDQWWIANGCAGWSSPLRQLIGGSPADRAGNRRGPYSHLDILPPRCVLSLKRPTVTLGVSLPAEGATPRAGRPSAIMSIVQLAMRRERCNDAVRDT